VPFCSNPLEFKLDFVHELGLSKSKLRVFVTVIE